MSKKVYIGIANSGKTTHVLRNYGHFGYDIYNPDEYDKMTEKQKEVLENEEGSFLFDETYQVSSIPLGLLHEFVEKLSKTKYDIQIIVMRSNRQTSINENDKQILEQCISELRILGYHVQEVQNNY